MPYQLAKTASDHKALCRLIMSGGRPDIRPATTSGQAALIEACWCVDGAERTTFAAISRRLDAL